MFFLCRGCFVKNIRDDRSLFTCSEKPSRRRQILNLKPAWWGMCSVRLYFPRNVTVTLHLLSYLLTKRMRELNTTRNIIFLRCFLGCHEERSNIYWLTMNAFTPNSRATGSVCLNIIPSQPQETIAITPSLEWPFQQIVMDFIFVVHVGYLIYTDRLTSCLILYHLKSGHAPTSK